MMDETNAKIAIIGLGYVGLPLAVEFGKVFETIVFDIKMYIKYFKFKRNMQLELIKFRRLTCGI